LEKKEGGRGEKRKQKECGATQKEVEQKESISRAEHMIQNQVMVEAGRYKNGNERESCFMLGSQRPHCHERENTCFVDSKQDVGQKDQMPSTTDRYQSGMLHARGGQQSRKLLLLMYGHSGW